MAWSPIRQRQLLAFLSVLGSVMLLGTLLAITDHGVFFPFRWTADYTHKSYGITIDAGSHGTRGHLYEWSGRIEDPQNPQLRPVTIPEEIYTYEPGLKGISEFINQPKNVGLEVLKPIVDNMKQHLSSLGCSEARWPSVPIFVKATAGMRNMDADAAESIFTAIRDYLIDDKASPFFFKRDYARVISGEEEGVFGWLAVNSEHGTLLEPAQNTIGALDLGGASAQITFMPTTASVLEDFYEVSLGERVVRLYSHSFLGYGWDDSRMRVTTRLALGAFFNALQADLGPAANNSTAVAILDRFQGGSMQSFVKLNGTISEKAAKHAIYVDPLTVDLPTYVLKAGHPCFPPGLELFFDVPSLMYPDGRFFLDIDDRAIASYMAIVGYDFTNHVIKKSFVSSIVQEAQQSPLKESTLRPVMENVLRDLNTSGNSAAKGISIANGENAPFHPFAEPLPTPKIRFRVLFEGKGDMQECQNLAKQLFYKEPCFLSSCSYNGVYQPRVGDSHFLALGQFAKVRAALDIPTVSTPNTIEKKAATICRTPWRDLVTQQESGAFKPFAKWGVANLCWKAVWSHTTLTRGYGFDGDSHAVTFFDINDPTGGAKSPGWALGAMLNEVSAMPWESARGRYQTPFWWAFGTLIVLGTLALLQSNKIKALRQKIPQPRSDMYIQYSPAEQLIQHA